MSVKIAICSESREDIKILIDVLYAYNSTFQISSYTNEKLLLDEYEEKEILFDILFLDVNLSRINGIEVARKIREYTKDLKIIFMANCNKYYEQAYDVFAFNYLIRPINTEKLREILDYAVLNISNERRRQISFKYKSVAYRIFCRDILYLESKDKVVIFHLADQTTLQCYSKLCDILKQLPEEYFIRCHQSFVVNIFYVSKMKEDYFIIDSKIIKISNKYKKQAKDRYFKYIFN